MTSSSWLLGFPLPESHHCRHWENDLNDGSSLCTFVFRSFHLFLPLRYMNVCVWIPYIYSCIAEYDRGMTLVSVIGTWLKVLSKSYMYVWPWKNQFSLWALLFPPMNGVNDTHHSGSFEDCKEMETGKECNVCCEDWQMFNRSLFYLLFFASTTQSTHLVE